MEHLPGRKDIKLIIADSDLKPITVVRNWTSIESDLTQNTAGSGQFAAPVSERLVDLANTPGNRVHLYCQNRYFCGGPIEVTTQDEPAKSDGVVTVNWTTDLASLAGRLLAPVPANELDDQSSAPNYVATGNAETVLRTMVNLNAGPGARVARQIPHLVLGTANSPLAGTSVSVSAPLSTNLMDQMRDTASAGGSLAFDVVLQDNSGTPELAFVVWAPSDVSSVVRFSKGLGNLNSLSFTRNSPTATLAVVGQEATTDTNGATVAGNSIIRSDSSVVSKWGRVEQWVSSTADTSEGAPDPTAQMQQDGDLALLSGSESIQIDADVFDTPKRQYGVNYRLGDIVGIQPATGAPIKDTVTAVKLTADPKGGATIAPTIGTGDARNGKALIDYVLQLQRRIARLEAGR